jgi:hypothetical protein
MIAADADEEEISTTLTFFALVSTLPQIQWFSHSPAAAYLASRGDTRSAWTIRGLVRAIPRRQHRGWNPKSYVETRLRDAEMRNTTLGALNAVSSMTARSPP